MTRFVFAGYAFVHFLLFLWALNLWRRREAPGALILAIMAAGLVYDNSLISLGRAIGIGPTLETLSWPRFILHALVTPFLMIATLQIARTAGLEWAGKKLWQGAIWVLTLAMIVYGVVFDLLPLEIQPACINDVVRFTSSTSPSQFCFADQTQNPGVGPPVPSIVADILIIIVGVMLLRAKHWHWMLSGGVAMFLAAAFPVSRFGLLIGNGGEVLLITTMVMSSARFAGYRK